MCLRLLHLECQTTGVFFTAGLFLGSPQQQRQDLKVEVRIGFRPGVGGSWDGQGRELVNILCVVRIEPVFHRSPLVLFIRPLCSLYVCLLFVNYFIL